MLVLEKGNIIVINLGGTTSFRPMGIESFFVVQKGEKMKHEYGNFGGQYVPKEVVRALDELELNLKEALTDEEFISEYKNYLRNFVGRPSPLYFAENLTKELGGAKIYFKREDLNHTGAHKINNTIGQMLLAKRMGKKKVIAETGAGQHGVATATAAALFGLECEVFMGEEDMRRASLNVYKMELLGAKVTAVKTGTRTLADAVDYAINQWVERLEDTFYCLGSAVGPHPYPYMVTMFQKIIGEEVREQIMRAEGKIPDYLIACVGGGSNAIGLYHEFLDDDVKIIGVEAAGEGIDTKLHAATMTLGREEIIHGMRTIVVLDENGKVPPVYSISPGLDYPGVGPQHSHLKETGRVSYTYATDSEAIEAMKKTSKLEGIIPALESSHALAEVMKLAPKLGKDQLVVVNISGRGDKDLNLIRGRESHIA